MALSQRQVARVAAGWGADDAKPDLDSWLTLGPWHRLEFGQAPVKRSAAPSCQLLRTLTTRLPEWNHLAELHFGAELTFEDMVLGYF